MRTPLHSFFVFALAISMLILSSCRKERLLLKEDPDAIGQFCQIDTFNFGAAPPYYEQVMISYNHAGDPVTMLPSVPDKYGEDYDDIYFRYDKSDRLVDFFFVYPAAEPYTVFPLGSIDLWHRFSYPGPRTVVDSFFNYDGPGIPPVANPPAGYSTLTVSRYELDEKGRIMKTYIQYIASVASYNDTFYTRYDGRGNVVIPGITYDNKVNVYRTNKIWQLIFQDYSMNNPIYPATPFYPATTNITSFNKFGLPLQYAFNEGNPFPRIFLYQYSYLGISYSCDRQSGKLISN